MADIHLEMRRITKRFPGITALDQVTMQVNNREIHALVGENGAGKSTLMKVLSGVYPYGSYEGEIFLNGEECRFRDIRESEHLGIVIIHQELALIPYLSIAENIFLGNEQAKNSIIDWFKTSSRARELLATVGLDENPATLVGNIGVGKQQLVEIAKALAKNVKLLILDEPTAALNDKESNQLLDLLIQLKSEGITSILISHKLKEVEKVADAITVIRDGKVIDNLIKGNDEIDEDRIIKSMVGRELTNRFPERETRVGQTVFEVRNWSFYHPQHENRLVINRANFHVRKGEVIGFAGLMGAGRTELVMSLFGKSYGRRHSGQVLLNGNEIVMNSVSDAIDNGIAYVTEDRKGYGLILIDDIRHNLSLPSLKNLSNGGMVNSSEEVLSAEKYRKKISIKCSGIDQNVDNLSGGNQQKVVLGKWIMLEPEVLILDEPTRGIDVGAKYEIYQIINQLAAEGKSIIMISSEMPELLGMCDRIYVVAGGEIAGELDRQEASQESIMKIIMSHQNQSKEISHGQPQTVL
ncbi:multiple monosaccharide ABC transporter ATP-binding protein [Marispirochaeta aestuarii]|uniref:multiple monosaccharide ABC transporter ATP-binding protein n=1 Tax=Marispirochaeta aestuarii TaxID=1963862 RepID=UPI0029C8BCBF|nr:multiple monosaccharide ABC transporter ATP-binding protein [Marispirochaeta aestuarii]